MADVSELQADIRRWASRVRDTAVSDIEGDLDKRVPVGPPRAGGGVRLADSRTTRRFDRGTVTGAEIDYAADHAIFTDQGTRPDRKIQGRPLLAFFWPRVGRSVVFRHVNHPGTAAQRWWSDVMTASRWGDALRSAARRTRL